MSSIEIFKAIKEEFAKTPSLFYNYNKILEKIQRDVTEKKQDSKKRHIIIEFLKHLI